MVCTKLIVMRTAVNSAVNGAAWHGRRGEGERGGSGAQPSRGGGVTVRPDGRCGRTGPSRSNAWHRYTVPSQITESVSPDLNCFVCNSNHLARFDDLGLIIPLVTHLARTRWLPPTGLLHLQRGVRGAAAGRVLAAPARPPHTSGL